MGICQFQGLSLASLSLIHIINGLFGTHFSLLNVAEPTLYFDNGFVTFQSLLLSIPFQLQLLFLFNVPLTMAGF